MGKWKHPSPLKGGKCPKPRETWGHHRLSIPVSRYTLAGEKLDDWDSVGLALAQIEAETGRDKSEMLRTSVVRCCKGDLSQSYGYKWSFRGEKLPECKNRKCKKAEIYGYNIHTKETRRWDCVADALEDLIGRRDKNYYIRGSLISPKERKRSLRRVWYFFYDKEDIADFTPAKNTMSPEQAKLRSQKAIEAKRVPVRAINVKDETDFTDYWSATDAAEAITGNRGNSSNILQALRPTPTGRRAKRFGYYFERLEKDGE